MDNYDELLKLFIIKEIIINNDIICILCKQPFNGVCEYCGITSNRQEYGCFDLYNYSFIEVIKYKQIVHFHDVLNHLQSKESRVIPEVVYTSIKESVDGDISKINKNLVLRVLKQHKYTKYIENSNMILFNLTGILPPYINKSIEDKLTLYFKDILYVYNSFKSNRTNFLNYHYVIYKLLEMMKHDELLIFIPLLKSKYRLRQHDKIWLEICNALEFEYIKTA